MFHIETFFIRLRLILSSVAIAKKAKKEIWIIKNIRITASLENKFTHKQKPLRLRVPLDKKEICEIAHSEFLSFFSYSSIKLLYKQKDNWTCEKAA